MGFYKLLCHSNNKLKVIPQYFSCSTSATAFVILDDVTVRRLSKYIIMKRIMKFTFLILPIFTQI